jgi:hypothetical protein
MGKFALAVVALIFIGGAFGDGSEETSDPGSDYSGYNGDWRDDSNGNPVPEDCAAWADSSDNPFQEGDPYAEQHCNEW